MDAWRLWAKNSEEVTFVLFSAPLLVQGSSASVGSLGITVRRRRVAAQDSSPIHHGGFTTHTGAPIDEIAGVGANI